MTRLCTDRERMSPSICRSVVHLGSKPVQVSSVGEIMSATSQAVPWTAVVLTAVGVSSLAATLVTLAWQFIIWRWSGARIVSTAYAGSIIGASIDPTPVITIRASNKGRGSCEITQWSFDDGTDINLVFPSHEPGSSELPVKLEGLHSKSWMIKKGPFTEYVKSQGITRIRPVIFIGSGKKFHGKWVDVKSLIGDTR